MTRGAAYGLPGSRGSKRETFLDTEDNFDNESDDDSQSVCGEFTSSASNTFNNQAAHAAGMQRPVRTTIRAEFSKVDDWMAATSGEEYLPSPALESDLKNAFPFGAPNGMAALVGSPDDSIRGEEKLDNARLPYKESQVSGSEPKGPVRGKWERAVSDLLGRKSSGSAMSPTRNAALQSPPETAGDVGKSNDHKAVFDVLCLPRLRTTVSTSRSRSRSPTSVKERSSMMKFSLRRKASAEHDDQDSVGVSSKFYVQRPLGGSQVAHTSRDRPLDGCWSDISSSCFKLRGKQYAKDKWKIVASNLSAYVSIGVDLLMSARKIDHIADHVKLPFQDLPAEADSMVPKFIVNIQLPGFPPAIFMSDTDGEGLSLDLYFKLSEEMVKAAPPYYNAIFWKFVQNELHKVKGFEGKSVVPFKDRLKVARCIKPDDVPLSAAEKKLFASYNEKPVLSRPQHVFYKGLKNLEVDMDVHRFSYIARKGFEVFRDRLKTCLGCWFHNPG